MVMKTYGLSAATAAIQSRSVRQFNSRGNWETVANTVTGGVAGAMYAYNSTSRGSTALKKPTNLTEQLALEEVRSDPQGILIIDRDRMNDLRWPGTEGWVKMAQQITTSKGNYDIHYVYNEIYEIFDDFKIH